ncbi:Retrovirus-related Pol polyprotein from transposon 17.6 [Anabarilius grahami]|uniref:Gypsy retrotransposon integrase-like protein 1 n=1 Tax=Anabarilius grahami TaxID=495550 RepID=A0A3N0YYH4_ANAGA|nr:Retrovirus-related Pol polyprotein from transposon 17.6 [Anabarilius grahami]
MDTKYGRKGKGARSTKQSHPAQRRSEDRKQTATSQQRQQCFRCGSEKHLANDKNCPAVKVACRLCGKKGHFAKVCKAAVSEVREVVVPDVTVLCVDNIKQSTLANDKITCEVNIEAPGGNKHMLQLVVDTGASVSILPEAVYKKHFSQCTSTKPNIKLVTYAKENLPVVGCLSALVGVSANDNLVSATFYVVAAGSPLLGLDLIRLLNLDIVSGKVKPIDNGCEISPAPSQTAEHSTSPVYTVSPVSATHLGLTPVRQKLRRLPLSIRKEVSTELNRLLTAGIIEPVDASEWVSPLVVVRKRDGHIRLCVDLREPNKSVIMDCYPLPHMEDLFTELVGASHYSQIDLSSAYHQLPLHPDSRNLTAFITHEGLFRFTRVPFGLASAPSAFQKMMQMVLRELDSVQNYLDDIIVYGNSQEAHDKNLQAVRQRLEEVGLQINFDKSSFNQASILFLGHVISKEGLRPSPDHLTAIAEAPRPTDMVALRSFLGLTSWFNKFLPNYATVVEPLRQMLRADAQTPLQWSKETVDSFDTLKRMLMESPVLAIYDPSLTTFITTEASDYGLGAVLTQLHPDGVERVIAFASRTLSTSEWKYSTVEKEALACVWAVEKWRTYVWGHHFTLRTDHQALTTLLSTKGMNRAGMRVACWSARLLCFQYDVQYRPGSKNCVADCLSRLPLSHTDTTVSIEQDLISEIAEIQPFLTALPLVDFKAECEDCSELSQLRQTIQSGWPKLQKSVSSDLRLYFPVRHELAVESPLIFRGNRLIVPIALRERLIHLAHEGHQGLVRTKQCRRELYWWPRMDDLVHTILSMCVTCQASDKSDKTFTAPMQAVEFPKGPFQHVAIRDVPIPQFLASVRYQNLIPRYRY